MVIFNYRLNVKNDLNLFLKLIELIDLVKIWLGKLMNYFMMLFRKNYSYLIIVGVMFLISLNFIVIRVIYSWGMSVVFCEL